MEKLKDQIRDEFNQKAVKLDEEYDQLEKQRIQIRDYYDK